MIKTSILAATLAVGTLGAAAFNQLSAPPAPDTQVEQKKQKTNAAGIQSTLFDDDDDEFPAADDDINAIDRKYLQKLPFIQPSVPDSPRILPFNVAQVSDWALQIHEHAQRNLGPQMAVTIDAATQKRAVHEFEAAIRSMKATGTKCADIYTGYTPKAGKTTDMTYSVVSVGIMSNSNKVLLSSDFESSADRDDMKAAIVGNYPLHKRKAEVRDKIMQGGHKFALSAKRVKDESLCIKTGLLPDPKAAI